MSIKVFYICIIAMIFIVIALFALIWLSYSLDASTIGAAAGNPKITPVY